MQLPCVGLLLAKTICRNPNDEFVNFAHQIIAIIHGSFQFKKLVFWKTPQFCRYSALGSFQRVRRSKSLSLIGLPGRFFSSSDLSPSRNHLNLTLMLLSQKQSSTNAWLSLRCTAAAAVLLSLEQKKRYTVTMNLSTQRFTAILRPLS